ncbi:MAG: exodeoxyribonuclease VII large subunit [bacterium]|nr:exodeoxyribonuclease VII large subunit [bacterium]
MNHNYISVTQINKYIKYVIDNDKNLNTIYLKGEISNFKNHTRGHLYFTLKDEYSRINAIMFSSNASKLKFIPTDGMKVLVTGKVSVYESNGAYQIYVNDMIEDGIGNLYIAYEQLKKKLELEGLFDLSHKKKIPKIPETIGIITAPTGAAIKDILSTIKRRWPIASTILFPSLVQGEQASSDIIRNIEIAKKFDLDVLIIGRGGGSIEDLWCFNDEGVARAIYNLDIPVISAVGHEIDFTICDFVADLRAPTPTGAAEMAVPNMSDCLNYLKQIEIRSVTSINNIIRSKQDFLNKLMDSPIIRNPISIYEIKEQKFDMLYEKLIKNFKNIIDVNKHNLEIDINNLNSSISKYIIDKKHNYSNLLCKLEVLNPLLTLKRGYAIVRTNNKVISHIKEIDTGSKINIELQDGNINAIVE